VTPASFGLFLPVRSRKSPFLARVTTTQVSSPQFGLTDGSCFPRISTSITFRVNYPASKGAMQWSRTKNHAHYWEVQHAPLVAISRWSMPQMPLWRMGSLSRWHDGRGSAIRIRIRFCVRSSRVVDTLWGSDKRTQTEDAMPSPPRIQFAGA